MISTLNAPKLSATVGTARAALDAMIASPARHVGLSLDALHRAVGSPERQGPDDFLDLCRPVVDGLKSYRKRLHAAIANEQAGPLVVRDPIGRANAATIRALDAIAGAGHGYAERDYLVDEEAAALYAMFLDCGGLRRNLTAEGKRQRRDFEAKLALLPGGDKVRRIDPLSSAPPLPAVVG